jgi:DNA-directed RNA polymerase subunit beta'
VLGTYYLTKAKVGSKGEHRVYKDFVEIDNNLRFNNLKESAVIAVPLSMYGDKFAADIEAGYKYVVTTVGRVIFNNVLPSTFAYLNEVNEAAFDAIPSKYLVKSADELEAKFKELETEFTPFKKGNIHRIIEVVYERYPENIAEVLDGLKALGF